MSLILNSVIVNGQVLGESTTAPAPPPVSPPVANFTGSPTTGVFPFTVNFTDTSTGSPTAWLWDFKDDGTATSTLQNPSYTYTSAGTYTVKLTATNAGGSNSVTKTNYITVNIPAPVANFTASPTSGEFPLSVTFTDTSTNSPTSWAWDFTNDGSTDSTQQNPTFVYNSAGTYTVKLTVTNAGGGNTVTKTNFITVTTPAAPVANFTGTPLIGLTPLSVNFTNTSTGSQTSWAWDFDNNGSTDSTLQNPTHSYTSEGTYSVKLTATGPGGSGDLTRSNYVTVYDSNGPYTTLVLDTNGINASTNNTFIDGSSFNATVTRSGNATQGSASPFSRANGYWSNYFSGSNYITAPSNTSYAFGTGDFTLEGWVYISGLQTSSVAHLFGSATNGIILRLNGTTPSSVSVTRAGTGTLITGNFTFVFNTWYHIAASRQSGTTRIFVNGTQVASATDGNDYAQVQAAIGSANGGANGFIGYISNFRAVKGTALYTSSFAPSITPLTAVSGTGLLTCQSNRIIDNSTNNLALAPTGAPRVMAFQPFGQFVSYNPATMGGSAYFDGTTDFIFATGNYLMPGNFTFETWIYMNSNTGVRALCTFGNETTGRQMLGLSGGLPFVNLRGVGVATIGSTAFQPHTWEHIAFVRLSGTITVYRNGVSVGTVGVSGDFGNTNNFYIGADSNGASAFQGAMSGTRLLNIALYTGNFTPPTAPPTAITNTRLLVQSANSGIYDDYSLSDFETRGTAQVSTAQSRWGGSSILFNGTGNFLHSSMIQPITQFGADFTVELWVYFNSLSGTQTLFSTLTELNGQNIRIYKDTDNAIKYWSGISGNGAIRITGGTVATGQWYHIALSRSGSNSRLFINGVQSGSTFTDNAGYLAGIIGIGSYGSATIVDQAINGYVQGVRITNGVARYTGTFTPPTGY